jgi:hypothetical protein
MQLSSAPLVITALEGWLLSPMLMGNSSAGLLITN